ncbi:MAG: hypothetical protein SFU86_17950 [Pirellulaceae bacterium]|nr:hypothetical protein [Pirellulaceae bacterium]
MSALVLWAAWGLVPYAAIPTDQADVIELNHYFDPEGRQVFSQVIFWGWYGDEGAFRVLAWRLWKSPPQTPEFDWINRRWQTVWHDGGELRRVTAATFHESWTQFDPEAEDRAYLPPAERRGLSGEVVSKPY